MLIIGNLGAVDVDPDAEHTRHILKMSGAHAKLPPHVESNIALTVAYALAAMQNTCSFDADFVGVHREGGSLMGRLRQLKSVGEPRVEQYATGCLINMRQTAARVKREELRAWATRERERVRTALPQTRLASSQSEAVSGRLKTASAEAWAQPHRAGTGAAAGGATAWPVSAARGGAASPRRSVAGICQPTGAAERRTLPTVLSVPALRVWTDEGPDAAAAGVEVCGVGGVGGERVGVSGADGAGCVGGAGGTRRQGGGEEADDETYEDAREEAEGVEEEGELGVDGLVAALDQTLGVGEPGVVGVRHSKLPYQGTSAPQFSGLRRKIAPQPTKLPVNERPEPDLRLPRESAPPPKDVPWLMYPVARPAEGGAFARGAKLKSGELISR